MINHLEGVSCPKCGYNESVRSFVVNDSKDVKVFPDLARKLTNQAEKNKCLFAVQDQDGYDLWTYTPKSRTERRNA